MRAAGKAEVDGGQVFDVDRCAADVPSKGLDRGDGIAAPGVTGLCALRLGFSDAPSGIVSKRERKAASSPAGFNLGVVSMIIDLTPCYYCGEAATTVDHVIRGLFGRRWQMTRRR